MIHPTLTSGPAFAGLKIGLLGGSFNPAHEGHVEVSLCALKRLALDQIWWLVSPQNPLKDTKDMAPFEQRVAGARAFTAPHPKIIVTDLEASLKSRFTYDTINTLKKKMPKVHFVWLMGADNLAQVHQWENWQDLFNEVPIAVFRRPGYPCGRSGTKAADTFRNAWVPLSDARSLAERKPPAWLVLDNKENPISATAIRRAQTRKQTL